MIPSSPKLNEPSEISKLDEVGSFRLLKRITLDYTDTIITKWQSQDTGLRVVHVDYEGKFSKNRTHELLTSDFSRTDHQRLICPSN